MRPVPRRDERGTAIVEFVWLGLLLLVPLLYVVLAAFEVQRTAFASSAAARSATRAFVTSPDQATGHARAAAAARLAFRDQGLDGGGVTLSCRPDPTACLTPGSVVVATIERRVVLPLMPSVFGSHAPSIEVDARHESPYGEFREARE